MGYEPAAPATAALAGRAGSCGPRITGIRYEPGLTGERHWTGAARPFRVGGSRRNVEWNVYESRPGGLFVDRTVDGSPRRLPRVVPQTRPADGPGWHRVSGADPHPDRR